MKLTLIFKIKFKTDYHLGAGIGKGLAIDSALLRDGDDVPVLRGTTITGLLRDSMWQLLQLTPLRKYQDQDIPNYIFGSATQPKHWSISSARPEKLLLPTNNYYETDIEAVQRVRINPRTRRSSDNQLFSQENGDHRLEFYFEATTFGEKEIVLTEASVLVASACHLRHLGHSRRRGYGQCNISLKTTQVDDIIQEDITQQALLKHFEEQYILNNVKLTRFQDELPSITPQISLALHTKRVRLIIRTDEPLLLARQNEAGNQYDTLDFISGTVLRGAFATLVAKQNNLQLSNTYQKFIELFWRGQIMFPYLYPTRRKGSDLFSTIPTPFDITTCKVFSGLEDYRHGLVAQSINPQQYCPHPDCSFDLKSQSGFITIEKNQQIISLQKSNEMHIRLDPITQRVTTGNLFGYNVLNVGQYFVGEISFTNDTIFSIFQDMIALDHVEDMFELRLGKATRRGYGKVTAYLKPCDNEEAVWVRLPFDKRVSSTSSPILILTFLTDAILMDEWGRYLIHLNNDWLQNRLKISISQCEIFTKSRKVDSFNTYMGLPRPRDIVISAGTSIGIQVTEDLTSNQLQYLKTVEQKGLGLRQNEGFGQIVFNHPIYYGQHQAIRGNAVRLDNIKMADVDNDYFSVALKEFTQKWQDELNLFDEIVWRDHTPDDTEKLIAVLKWLQSNADQPLELLQNQIAQWQNGFMTNNNLTNLIPDYGPPKYHLRELKKMKQAEVLDKIIGLMPELKKLLNKYPTVNQATAITLLADRIATEAKQAQKETSS